MKRVFISHPYKDDPKGNKKRVDTICRELAERDDILPISPLHLFSFMEDDLQREKYSRCVSGLLIYAMRFGYMGTAKVARRKGNMLFPEGKRF
jgi:hypothetical protein